MTEINENIAAGAAVFTTQVANTYAHQAHIEDLVGGPVPIAAAQAGSAYFSNARLILSSHQVPNLESSIVLTGPFAVTAELPDPFTGEGVARTVGHLEIENVETYDNVRFADLDDAPFKYYRGEPADLFDGYELYLDGTIESHAYDDGVMRVTLSTESEPLKNQYPVNVFGPEGGEAEGSVKPVYLGPVRGDRPVSLGQGLYFMTDGELVTDDAVEVGIGAFEYDDENLYYYQKLLIQQGYAVDDAGYTFLTSEDFTFTGSGSQVTATGLVGATVEVEGPASLSVSEDGLIEVTPDEGTIAAYTATAFNWRTTPDGVTNAGDPKVSVTVGGAVDVVDTGGRWFKIAANGSGPVSFDLGGNVRQCKLIVRAIRTAHQSFTPEAGSEPDRITPPFGYTENGQEVFNHTLVYNNLNSDTLDFTYTADTDVLLCAIWFESIEYRELTPIDVRITFDSPVYQAGLVFSVPADGVDFDAWTPAEPTTLPEPDAVTLCGFGNVEAPTLGFKTYQSAVFGFAIDSLKVSDVSTYGVEFDEGVIRMTPPPVADTVGSPTTAGSFGTFFKSQAFVSFNQGLNYTMKGKARLLSSDVEKVYMTVGTDNVIEVGEEVNDFEVVAAPLFTGTMGARVWRGTSRVQASLDLTNPDDDYTIELTDVHFSTAYTPEAAINVYSVVDEVRTPLKVFRVADARAYQGILPLELAVYDDKGFLAVSRKYSDIAVDATGYAAELPAIDAARLMSVAAAGQDLITCDFAGEHVGFKVGDQKPVKDHLNNLFSILDYYGVEDRVGDGVTVSRRWRYDTYPNDFNWSSGVDIVAGSVQRVGSRPRQSRYIVEYLVDGSDASKTKAKTRATGYVGAEAKTLTTPLIEGVDAQALADLGIRDSQINGVFTMDLVGVGLPWRIGMVGFISDPLIPKRKPCVILAIDPDDARGETAATVLVIKGRGVHRG